MQATASAVAIAIRFIFLIVSFVFEVQAFPAVSEVCVSTPGHALGFPTFLFPCGDHRLCLSGCQCPLGLRAALRASTVSGGCR